MTGSINEEVNLEARERRRTRDDSKSLLPPLHHHVVGPSKDDSRDRLCDEASFQGQNSEGDGESGAEKSSVVESDDASDRTTIIHDDTSDKEEEKVELKNTKNLSKFFNGMFSKKPLVCSGSSTESQQPLDSSASGEEQSARSLASGSEDTAEGDNSGDKTPTSDSTAGDSGSRPVAEEESKPVPTKKVSFFRQFSKEASSHQHPTVEADDNKSRRQTSGLKRFFIRQKSVEKQQQQPVEKGNLSDDDDDDDEDNSDEDDDEDDNDNEDWKESKDNKDRYEKNKGDKDDDEGKDDEDNNKDKNELTSSGVPGGYNGLHSPSF